MTHQLLCIVQYQEQTIFSRLYLSGDIFKRCTRRIHHKIVSKTHFKGMLLLQFYEVENLAKSNKELECDA